MTKLLTAMALATLAAAQSVGRFDVDHGRVLDVFGADPPQPKGPTLYRAPKVNHEAHIAKAEAKRVRKAQKLAAIADRGGF